MSDLREDVKRLEARSRDSTWLAEGKGQHFPQTVSFGGLSRYHFEMQTVTALSLLSLLVGCTTTQTYQVSIKNNTSDPITFGLVKEGDPVELQWISPEDAAIGQQRPSTAMWGAIPPGREADSGPVRGRFNSKASAILRVYDGELSLSGILAISRGQPNRLDIPLHPGLNRFIVSQQGAQLDAIRNEAGGASPANP